MKPPDTSTSLRPEDVCSGSLANGKSNMSYALTGLVNRNRSSSEGSWDSSPDKSEPEDGGILVGSSRKASQASIRNRKSHPSIASWSNEQPPSTQDLATPTLDPALPGSMVTQYERRKSIQVTIEQTKGRGKERRFTVRADDPEFRAILQSCIEREAAILSGKSSRQFRDLVFTRQFTTFDRQNPRSAQSPFYGFFVLFWLAMFLLLCKIAAQNYRNTGSVLGTAEILHLMIDRDLLLLGITDGALASMTGFSYLLQKAIVKGYFSWSTVGWIIQSLWEVFYTASFIGFTFYRNWPWTHTVFVVLHTFTLLMKQHSYAFYNGYLSQVYRRRQILEKKLNQLEQLEATDHYDCSISPLPSPIAADGHFSLGPKASINLQTEDSSTAILSQTLSSDKPLSSSQIRTFNHLLSTEISNLSSELRGHSKTASPYPTNLTLGNFVDYTTLPTLIYELSYPRQDRINWYYVAEKAAATLGVIWVMIIISQAYIYPVVISTVQQNASGVSLDARWKEYPWVVFDMLFPLLLEQLLAWYAIWECLLNVLAELTRFADRGFYGDWWNSVSYAQYARDWNRPVHNFLLRHVYHSSISALRVSKSGAMLITFLLSAVVHEVLMFCLFKKVRGYLFVFQLTQIPLAALSRTKVFRKWALLGNVVFWLGLFVGPSIIMGLYLVL